MLTEEIRKDLFLLQDKKYRDFQAKLIPTAAADSIIGVRTPELRKYAKKLAKRDDISVFLDNLPHQYFISFKYLESASCHVGRSANPFSVSFDLSRRLL